MRNSKWARAGLGEVINAPAPRKRKTAKRIEVIREAIEEALPEQDTRFQPLLDVLAKYKSGRFDYGEFQAAALSLLANNEAERAKRRHRNQMIALTMLANA